VTKRSLLAWGVLAGVQVTCAEAQTSPDAQPPPGTAAAQKQGSAPTSDASNVEPMESVVVSGHFLGSAAESAMKLDVAVRDTPFAVQSYTESFMKAIETTNVGDLYNYMTGVKRAGNTGYDLTIRGFKTSGTDRNAIMVDGLPGLTGRFGSPPTIGVDHIELVKGPMSVLYGQIQPGGFVNLISKKPRSTRSAELDVKGTGYDGGGLGLSDAKGYEVSGDVTGPIDAAHRFLFRLTGQYYDRNLFRDFSYEKSQYGAGGLTWNMSDATSATVQFEYRKVSSNFDVGLAAPRGNINLVAPITTVYQERGNFRDEHGEAVSLSVSHSFTERWSWVFAGRSVQNLDDDSAYTSVAVRPDNVDLQRRARRNHIGRKYNYFDTGLKADLETGTIAHRVLLGVNGGRDTDDEDRRQFFNGGACPGPTCLDINLYDPIYGRVPPFAALPAVNPKTPQNLFHQLTTSDSLGAYVSDLMTLSERWKATLGIRTAHEKQELQELRLLNVPTQTKTADKGFLPMVGLLYQPDKFWTLYTSYAESYVPAPANSIDVNGRNPFKPTTAEQVEVGAKTEGLLGGRLSGTLALFRIDRKDVLDTFACSLGTCTRQIGAEQSKGLEIEMNARPLERWQLDFGYSLLESKVTSSIDPIQIGARLPNVARNGASLWSRYDVGRGALQGLGIGVGLVHTGERAGMLPTAVNPGTLRLPSYTVTDVAVYYLFKEYTVNLKVGNVFDKVYYESAGSTPLVQILPGAPRNIALELRRNFF
jgi:iron complex outermembrane recepter protein